MTTIDWIGFLGAMLLLAAYFLSSFRMIKSGGLTYILLNGIGAGIACLAAVLLPYLPFIILEGVWFIVAVIALIRLMNRKHKATV